MKKTLAFAAIATISVCSFATPDILGITPGMEKNAAEKMISKHFEGEKIVQETLKNGQGIPVASIYRAYRANHESVKKSIDKREYKTSQATYIDITLNGIASTGLLYKESLGIRYDNSTNKVLAVTRAVAFEEGKEITSEKLKALLKNKYGKPSLEDNSSLNYCVKSNNQIKVGSMDGNNELTTTGTVGNFKINMKLPAGIKSNNSPSECKFIIQIDQETSGLMAEGYSLVLTDFPAYMETVVGAQRKRKDEETKRIKDLDAKANVKL